MDGKEFMDFIGYMQMVEENEKYEKEKQMLLEKANKKLLIKRSLLLKQSAY